MKKQRRKNVQTNRKNAPQNTGPEKKDRRAALGMMRNGAVAAVVLGAGGYWGQRAYCATMTEHDLSRVGNGVPTVVQIHDPQCGLCRELQKETRAALRSFDDGSVNYVVANIRTTDGQSFAARHGVGHVTLLLFDGNGILLRTINGVTPRSELEDAFAANLRL
ncbi:MAG: thioredoxin family protein [Pseudomonadota bacterium]